MRHPISLLSSLVIVVSLSMVAGAADPSDSAATQDQIIQVLRKGLASDEFWPSMHAAEAMSLAGKGDEVRAALGPRLHSTEDAQHRCGVARELFRAGDKSAVAVLLEILADEDPHGHVHACESLFKIGQIGDGVMLRKHMQEGQLATKRLMAAAALARTGDAEALALLRAQVLNEDDNIARIAAWTLAVDGDASDLPALRSRLASIDNPQYQTFMLATMATLGDKAAGAKLQAALGSEDPGIRVFAAEFCGHAGLITAREALINLLQDENLDVRIRAAQSLLLLDGNDNR
ncbi:HEAT repeat domain-containing protein [Rosistilla oblonga]|uniref:HEAT repeat domain-containing protein n=1 Tax=Rosistilla oblonga TaxID=2527990 RepID=UPI003A9719D5